MKPEYVKLIAQVDIAICVVRTRWLQSPRDSVECILWYCRLNHLLDERIRLMKCRDSGPISLSCE